MLTAGGLPRPVVILMINTVLLSHLTPLPVWNLCYSAALNLGWRIFVGRNDFWYPAWHSGNLWSVKNLGSITTWISNSKRVTASFSSLNSSWVTFVWLGFFFNLLSFLSLSSSLASLPLLLLQTTLSCAPAEVWCWIAITLRIDSESLSLRLQ